MPSSAPTDEDLMGAYLAGDSAAFEALYRRHSGRVYGYLRRRLGSPELAGEVFQSAFLKLHASRSSYDPAYPFAQWLFVIVRTTLLDHYRKSSRQVKLAEEELNPELVSQTEGAPALNQLEDPAILSPLPSEQRKAIEMRVLEERSYEEIARALKRSEASVRQLVSRGLRKLRALGRQR